MNIVKIQRLFPFTIVRNSTLVLGPLLIEPRDNFLSTLERCFISWQCKGTKSETTPPIGRQSSKNGLGISDFRSHWSGSNFPRTYFSDSRPVEKEVWPKWLKRTKLPLGPTPTQPEKTNQLTNEQQDLCEPVFTPGKPPMGLASGLIAWSERPAVGEPGFWYRPSWPHCDIIYDLATFVTEIN